MLTDTTIAEMARAEMGCFRLQEKRTWINLDQLGSTWVNLVYELVADAVPFWFGVIKHY